ncbi:MAG: hypothetical protein J3K34DRAFT_444200 [Monoraphidium minutum]|nr:MAG: hypothetical protein J3K34DRAFT_444200 [Monoraphidium minutum]
MCGILLFRTCSACARSPGAARPKRPRVCLSLVVVRACHAAPCGGRPAAAGLVRRGPPCGLGPRPRRSPAAAPGAARGRTTLLSRGPFLATRRLPCVGCCRR